MSKTKLTPPQIAKTWGIDVAKVLGWIRSGELRAINVVKKLGGQRPRYLVDAADLAAFERARSATPPAKTVRTKRREQSVTRYF